MRRKTLRLKANLSHQKRVLSLARELRHSLEGSTKVTPRFYLTLFRRFDRLIGARPSLDLSLFLAKHEARLGKEEKDASPAGHPPRKRGITGSGEFGG